MFCDFAINGLHINFYMWKYGIWPQKPSHWTWVKQVTICHIKIIKNVQVYIFWSNSTLDMHQKLSHLRVLNGSLSYLMDWGPPGTAETSCQSIKSTKIGLSGHIELLIDQIWHSWKSLKPFFDFFSVIEVILKWVWP